MSEENRCFLRAYRSVGLFCDENPVCLNQTKDKDFLIASTDRSYKVYSLPSLQVKLNGMEFEHRIHAIVGQNERLYLAQKNQILRVHTYHVEETYSDHKAKVAGMLLLDTTLLSFDRANTLLVRQVGTHPGSPDTLLASVQVPFPLKHLLHPSTYLNKVLLVGSRQMTLLNVRTGKTIHSFSSLLCDDSLGSKTITCVQNSPVLNVVAIGYSDGTVQMLNLLLDQSVMSLAHPEGVTSLAFSQEDRPMLAVGDRKGSVTLWDLKEQQVLSKWQAHSEAISSVLFSAGNMLYSSSGQANHIAQWKYDPEDKHVFHLVRQRKGLQGSLQKVRFADALGYDVLTHSNSSSAELKNILLNNEGFLPQYSLTVKEGRKKKYEEAPFSMGEIKDSQMSSNNKFKHVLVRTVDSKHFQVFDSENKRLLKRKLDLKAEEGLEDVWHKQKHLTSIWVTNCGNFGLAAYDQGLVIKFNMQSHRVQSYVHLPAISEIRLLVSDLGNTQIIVGDDKTLLALDFLSLAVTRRVRLVSRVGKYCLSRVNDLLVIAHQDQVLRVYNPSLETCRVLKGHSMVVNDLCFSHDQRYILSAGQDRRLIVWDVISQKIVNQLITRKAIKSLDTSADGELLATLSHNSRQVDLWHNVLYLTPTTQTLLPLVFCTPLALAQQQDGRIYHYMFRRDQAAAKNELSLAQEVDEEKLRSYINIDIKEKRDVESEMVQLTSQDINKWMPLIDLDEIKHKNKVEIKEAQEAKLPFFLDFENKTAIKQQFEEEKREQTQIRSQILEKQKTTHMEEGNQLEQMISAGEVRDGQGQQVLEYLKTLLPSQVDYQLRQHSFQHILPLLQLVSQWFDSPDEYDLKSTYFNALLNTSYDAILASSPARQTLQQIQEKDSHIRLLLQDHLVKSICLLEKFTRIKS